MLLGTRTMHKPLEFTDEQRAAIEDARRHAPTWRERRRAEGILRLGRGESAAGIAEQLEADIESVHNWYWRWLDEGIASLRDKPRGGRPRKLTNVQQDRLCALAREAPHSIGELYDLLKAEYPDLNVHVDTLKDVLRAHHFRYKRTRLSLKKTQPDGIWICRPGTRGAQSPRAAR